MHSVKRLAVIGLQNSGKTRVVEAMVKFWTKNGRRVAVIKHDGHLLRQQPDDWEKRDSDTYKFASAGAEMTLLAGGGRTLLRRMNDGEVGDVLALCNRLEAAAQATGRVLDVVVVEGYKASFLPKIAVLRRPSDIEWLNERHSSVPWLVAAVCPRALQHLVEVDLQVYDEDCIPDLCTDLWERL